MITEDYVFFFESGEGGERSVNCDRQLWLTSSAQVDRTLRVFPGGILICSLFGEDRWRKGLILFLPIFKPFVQGLFRDAEQFCRLALIVSGRLQGLIDSVFN